MSEQLLHATPAITARIRPQSRTGRIGSPLYHPTLVGVGSTQLKLITRKAPWCQEGAPGKSRSVARAPHIEKCNVKGSADLESRPEFRSIYVKIITTVGERPAEHRFHRMPWLAHVPNARTS